MSFMEKETKRRNHSHSKTMDKSKETKNKKRNSSLDYKTRKRYYLIENTIESINFNDIYTPLLKKIYPLIINPDHSHNQNYYCSHKTNIDFFCFECHSHFCVQCQSNHKDHSFQSLEEIKINKKELNKVENSIEEKIDLLLKDLITKLNVKINEKSIKYKEEIIKFNRYIIANYKNEKILIIFIMFIIFLCKKNLDQKKINILW